MIKSWINQKQNFLQHLQKRFGPISIFREIFLLQNFSSSFSFSKFTKAHIKLRNFPAVFQSTVSQPMNSVDKAIKYIKTQCLPYLILKIGHLIYT